MPTGSYLAGLSGAAASIQWIGDGVRCRIEKSRHRIAVVIGRHHAMGRGDKPVIGPTVQELAGIDDDAVGDRIGRQPLAGAGQDLKSRHIGQGQ